jgi:hypothetical protein
MVTEIISLARPAGSSIDTRAARIQSKPRAESSARGLLPINTIKYQVVLAPISGKYTESQLDGLFLTLSKNRQGNRLPDLGIIEQI